MLFSVQTLILCICLTSCVFLVDCQVRDLCFICLLNRKCVPPDCFCCRGEWLLPFDKSLTPQIVYFTFAGAVTDTYARNYRQLFRQTRHNANGCPITMTLFVSHADTNYSAVSDLHEQGMEIGAHVVSPGPLNSSDFRDEAARQMENLVRLSAVPMGEIVGWRGPSLDLPSYSEASFLQSLGYKYSVFLRTIFGQFQFVSPFTLDYGMPGNFSWPSWPRLKGFWLVPLTHLGSQQYPSESETFKFLWRQFDAHYRGTRLPFGVTVHPEWLNRPPNLAAIDRFIDKLGQMPDVYVVSVAKGLDWLRRPTPLTQLNTFPPWSCKSALGSRTWTVPGFSLMAALSVGGSVVLILYLHRLCKYKLHRIRSYMYLKRRAL